MRGRKPEPLVLKPEDKKALQQLMHDGQTPLSVARRAQVLLSCAEAKHRVSAVSDKVGQNRSTVWRICQRYRAAGLEAAVYDAPRPGRPRVFSQRRAAAH